MTAPMQENQPTQDKTQDKELNFRMLEAKYEKQLAMERAERERLTQELQQRQQQAVPHEDDEDDEPYVNKKKLEKKLQSFGQQQTKQTQSEIQRAVQQALQAERRDNWLKTNSDFNQVMSLSQKFYEHDPELAETILEMPDTFERQKLVYKNIKALGLDKPVAKEQTIQEKIDANRRSPYYQPSGVGNAPYSSEGNFSETGQEAAYKQMKELQKRARFA